MDEDSLISCTTVCKKWQQAFCSKFLSDRKIEVTESKEYSQYTTYLKNYIHYFKKNIFFKIVLLFLNAICNYHWYLAGVCNLDKQLLQTAIKQEYPENLIEKIRKKIVLRNE